MSNGSNQQQYQKLEYRLTLLAWLNHLLGYQSNRELLEDIQKADEGFDASGHSHIYHRLISRGSKVQISPEDLARYDENIRTHLAAINKRRSQPITLRYFQYLAALYTEIVLDHLFNHKAQLLADLNAFVRQRNAGNAGIPSTQPGNADVPSATYFAESDLTKLACWMATGSGKTLILHLNYYQFLHYNNKPLNNILLITPNEGLSEQHLAELEASGIPARRFDLNQRGLWSGDRNAVQVIEITKLVEEKRGGGVSVPVEAFEGRNLIFVDKDTKAAAAKPGANTAMPWARPTSPSSTAPPSGRRSARRATTRSPPNTAKPSSSTIPTATSTATATARTSASSTCTTRPPLPVGKGMGVRDRPVCSCWAICSRSTNNCACSATMPTPCASTTWKSRSGYLSAAPSTPCTARTNRNAATCSPWRAFSIMC